MLTVEKLKNFGADTDEGLSRVFGNEALYLRLVNMIPNEENFDKLAEAIGKNDLDAAFAAAHALKGVLGNLSLTKMYEKCSEITELLRAHPNRLFKPDVGIARDERRTQRPVRLKRRRFKI